VRRAFILARAKMRANDEWLLSMVSDNEEYGFGDGHCSAGACDHP